MKNTLTALALAVFTAGIAHAQTAPAPVAVAVPTSDISVSGRFSWEAKNVFRGKERSSTDGLIQSTVSVESAVPGFAGVSAYVSYFNADNFERTLNIGGRTDLNGVGTIEFGVSRTSNSTAVATLAGQGFTRIDNSRELYVGVAQKPGSFIRTSAFLYYNTDLKQTNLVVAGSKDYEGKNLGIPGFDLETKAYVGLADSKASSHDVANSYIYLGASADVTRAIGTGAKVGLGVNWAYNTDGQAQTAGKTVWLKAYANFKF
ncbi:MAG: hypothetical protein K9M83_01835 [Opitutales bacterium]|jgi:hypothetical protein|nr:hypothetical protein [Opitutales bacterium]